MVTKKRGKKGPVFLAIVCQKGGAGKSLYTVNIATTLAMLGYNVLIVDTDVHQRTSLESFETSPNSGKVNVVVAQEENISKQFDNPSFTQGYDLVIIDGKAGMTKNTHKVLARADYFLVPLQPSKTQIMSFTKYYASVLEPHALSSKEGVRGGVVITGRTKNTVAAKNRVEDIRSCCEDLNVPVFNTEVLYDEAFENCQDEGLSIFQYKPQIKAAKNWFNFINELLLDLDLSVRKNSFDSLAKEGACFRKMIRKQSKDLGGQL